jgi:ubiquitin C-terminal hydrolase
MTNQQFDKRFTVQLNLSPSRTTEEDSEPKRGRRQVRYDDIQTDEYQGLVNEGTTCYMNSLLQTLFILGAFRNVVYKMPSDNEIVNCLQRIFYNLETTKEPVRTAELLMSFGWG